jgi:hypothetical protein
MLLLFRQPIVRKRRERLKVLLTGKVWQQVLTFNKPLQPQLMAVEKPHFQE